MIEANGLVRRFGDFVAVNDVTLHVPDGTILALLGPNGAGKTTTVRMLAGLLAPSEGTAVVAGFDVRRSAKAVRARVGLVTDVPGLYEQMTPPAYLDFFGAIYGLPRDFRTRRIDELLEFFDLAEHRKERMAGFSKGMKQKLALARALLHEPAALFLDEPTSGLDPLATRAVRELVVELKHSSRSIILCTHDLDEAERLADQVAIMRRGQIAAYDTPANLRAQASPEATVHIELAAAWPGAEDAVRAVPGVLGLDGSTAENDSVLVYRTADPPAVNPRVVARLVELGASVVTVTSSMRSLEDVYAHAMGGSDLTPSPSPGRRGESGSLSPRAAREGSSAEGNREGRNSGRGETGEATAEDGADGMTDGAGPRAAATYAASNGRAAATSAGPGAPNGASAEQDAEADTGAVPAAAALSEAENGAGGGTDHGEGDER